MPDDQPEIDDLNFAGEMHHLAYEAQAKAAAPPPPRLDRKELMLALGQMVRPLAIELENLKRVNSDNGVLLTILAKAAKTPAGPAEALDRISQQLQRIGVVETANQKLFDALHTELKGYKDGFLFDALQRPFIRDLVAIFDDFSAVHAQVSKRLAAAVPPRQGANGLTERPKAVDPANEDPAEQTETEFLRTLAGNVDNQVHHLLEVFLRLEVVLSRSLPGTPLDKKMHRTVAFEPARSAREDAQIVRSLKPGFTWRERMIRPEEVVVSRWNDDSPSAPPAERKDDIAALKYPPPGENRRSSPDAKNSKPR